MPRRPKRPCSYPGCPELVDSTYCAKHQKLVYKNYNRYRRSRESRGRYGRAWKKIRDRYIARHPFCEQCAKEGRMVLAEEVHHKKPLSEGGTSREDNLMSLCKSCHSKITRMAKPQSGRG